MVYVCGKVCEHECNRIVCSKDIEWDAVYRRFRQMVNKSNCVIVCFSLCRFVSQLWFRLQMDLQ